MAYHHQALTAAAAADSLRAARPWSPRRPLLAPCGDTPYQPGRPRHGCWCSMAADMTPAVDSVTSATGAAHGAERGAGGVVFDDRGRVLVLRHAGGNWVFPKGH